MIVIFVEVNEVITLVTMSLILTIMIIKFLAIKLFLKLKENSYNNFFRIVVIKMSVSTLMAKTDDLKIDLAND